MVPAGDFVAEEQPARRLLKPQVLAGTLGSGGGARKLLLLDSREPDEYTGATDPYEVARAGHVPGAVSFPWRTTFEPEPPRGADQTWADLLPCDTLRPRFVQALSLQGRPTAAAVEVGTYCTGGIRSGFLYLVLRECFSRGGAAGTPQWQVQAKNYDGGMWQWADDESLPMVLGDTPAGDARG